MIRRMWRSQDQTPDGTAVPGRGVARGEAGGGVPDASSGSRHLPPAPFEEDITLDGVMSNAGRALKRQSRVPAGGRLARRAPGEARETSEHRTEPLLQELPPRMLACAVCGVACPGGEQETVTVDRHRVTLGRCDDCTDLDGPDIAAAVLGLERQALSGVHPGPIFALRYAAHARPGHGTAEPWSHLTVGSLAEAREAAAAAQRRRILRAQPPVQVPPPALDDHPANIDGACLLCGIGTVPVPALTADGLDPTALGLVAWRHVVTSGLTPTTVRGWLCGDDAALFDEEGAVGVALVARSMRQVGLLEGDGLPSRLPSWAMLVLRARRRGQPSAPPSEQRWGHVPTRIRLVPAGWPPPLQPAVQLDGDVGARIAEPVGPGLLD